MGTALVIIAIATDPVRLIPMAVLGWFVGHRGIAGWAAILGAAIALALLTGMWVLIATVAGLVDAALAALVRGLFRRDKGASSVPEGQ